MQTVWWTYSNIGLQEGLVININNLRNRSELYSSPAGTGIESKGILPDRFSQIEDRPCSPERLEIVDCEEYGGDGLISCSRSESQLQDHVLQNCQEYIRESEHARKSRARRDLKISKALRSSSGLHMKASSKNTSRKDWAIETLTTPTEWIEESELRRRQVAGECQRCAWPRDGKRSHKTIDCFQWSRLVKGTAPFPMNERYKKDLDLGLYFSTYIERFSSPPTE